MHTLQGSRRLAVLIALAAVGAVAIAAVFVSRSSAKGSPLDNVKHIVVIYEENHSFDNLYGGWEGVNGRNNADAAHTTQVDQAGKPYDCLRQLDVNLTALTATCTDSHGFSSAFKNTWFTIDNYIAASDTTCPPPLQAFSFPNGLPKGAGRPGGCTRDIVHRFYQEQYQLNGGAQNRYMVGSDAAGTVMGVYDTKKLPVYQWLHSAHHPNYVIADNFFQAAFGGSFLNHQYLVAAQAPSDPNAPANQHSIVDTHGFPNGGYPLYVRDPTATYRDSDFTVTCPSPVANLACGNFAVNTMQPTYEPFGAFGDKIVPQTNPTIGDRLMAKNVDFGWYGGGWSNAAGDVNGPGWTNGSGPKCSDPNAATNFTFPKCPDNVFQFHHHPLTYYSTFAPGTPGRAHLQDEQAFIKLLDASRKKKGKTCALKPVSFVKPLGEENEHPGYASTAAGNSHQVALLQFIEGGNCAKDTMVIVTYDEFGGQWDHVPPPGMAGGPSGPHDQFGPGTRIPALIFAPGLESTFAVDHTEHDTTSILATIEHKYGLQPLATRDAAASDLTSVWSAKAATK